MKNLKCLTIFLMLMVSILSCKKSFLDVEDNNFIIRQQYVTDLKTTQQFLNGIYVTLSKDIYLAANQIYPDLVADNIKPTASNPYLLISHYQWMQNTSNSDANLERLWRSGYQLSRSCSFVIEKSRELSKEDPVKSKQMQAEAYGIRALMHFVLVNTFAQSYNFNTGGNHPGVPYITSSDWNDTYTRNTVAEVYTGIVNDLSQAIELFQSSPSTTLVMNKNAAKALLARVYLFKEDWQNAKNQAMEIANSVPLLATAAYPSKLFTKDETEALFQLSPSSVIVPSGGYDTYFQGYLFREGSTLFYFSPTKDIIDLLTQNLNDSRKNWVSSTGSVSFISKYPIDVVPGFGTDLSSRSRSYYQTLLRSSEMFLTVAEASAKLGDENTARTYLDAIRKRANPTATNSTATGTALIEAIHLERRKELAFEGLRIFDLLRWKQGVNRIDIAVGGTATLPYPSIKAIAPIPLIDQQAGMQQNNGY